MARERGLGERERGAAAAGGREADRLARLAVEAHVVRRVRRRPLELAIRDGGPHAAEGREEEVELPADVVQTDVELEATVFERVRCATRHVVLLEHEHLVAERRVGQAAWEKSLLRRLSLSSGSRLSPGLAQNHCAAQTTQARANDDNVDGLFQRL